MSGSRNTAIIAAVAIGTCCCMSATASFIAMMVTSKPIASAPIVTIQTTRVASKASTVQPIKAQKIEDKGAAKVPVTGPAKSQSPPSGKMVNTTTTYHTNFDTNACNNMKPDSSGRNTAMSASLATQLGVPRPGPGSSTCGRMLAVTDSGTGKTITVKVLDLRGDEHGLDMEQRAFVEVAGPVGVAAGTSNIGVGFV